MGVRSLHNHIVFSGKLAEELSAFIHQFLCMRLTTGSMPLHKVEFHLSQILWEHKIYDLKVHVYLDRMMGSYVVDFTPLHKDRPRWNRENKT